MKNRLLLPVLFAAVTILLASCSLSPTSPNSSGNLIENPYFRSGNSPSLAGWQVNDTAWVKVVANAPSWSKTWSLWLAPAGDIFGGGIATTYITGQSGRAVYRFSCWERNFGQWYWGFASLVQIRDGFHVSSRYLQMQDSSWMYFSLADTLNMVPSDTLQILFSAPSPRAVSYTGATPVDTISNGACFNEISVVKSE